MAQTDTRTNGDIKQALAMQAKGHRAPASEATLVEQSRAIAQVQGALLVAMNNPRDEIAARDRMEAACQTQQLAERAFYRFPRDGKTVTGPSIHLAAELARCWGNIDYGAAELRRDDTGGVSEMMTYAWDLETNTRAPTTFIVPHKRDKKGGPVALVDMREIYENNANNAARRLRECILRVLPVAFVEEAKTICARTLEHGGGEPIEKRRATLVQSFADLGVKRVQLERKMGKAADKLNAYDIGVLRVVYQSIRRGEVTIGDEFEDDTAGEVKAALKQQTGQQKTETPADPRTQEVDDAEGSEVADASPGPSKPETSGESDPSSYTPEVESEASDSSGPAIAVPLTEDGRRNWPAYRDAYLAAMEACESPSEMMDVAQANLETTREMEKKAPKSHAALLKRQIELYQRFDEPAEPEPDHPAAEETEGLL